MTDSTTITLIKELDVTDLSGEKVMIDFETGKYFMLKGAANSIWDFIQQPITLGDLVNKLLEEYEIEAETCKASVIPFIEQLKENGFVTLS